MKAPEQPHFMTEIVINEMSQLPNDITIDKPVPRKTRLDEPPFFKETYAEGNGGDRKKTGEKPVEYEN
jgi:hypothetical protein